jgi:site-specific DNA recombinase|tara:strand:- start:1013 stop:2605 length:1593 start_codon:yes stop_codon:yes gene_type:complete
MNQLEGKRALLYRRVSTSNQKEFGNSLSAQKSSLREFCVKKGVEVIKEFEEDYSAKDFDRPVFKEMLEFAIQNKNKIDYLLIVSWDRFSRNALEALKTISDFENLGIEINCINNWIDPEDPSQLIMQLMYLGLPEVDNRIRSQKVKIGMRQALKDGRWISPQPKGYVKGRDYSGKPLMQPDPEIAPLIATLFEEYSLGIYSQSHLLKSNKYKSLKLSRSNLSRILSQIAYSGRIKVPAYKDEQEQIVRALHNPLVSVETFDKVQLIMNKKRFNKGRSKGAILSPQLPLRGFLKCLDCGSNLTGSGSRSKTGKRHFYYHCNSHKNCKTRYKASELNGKFTELLESIKPPKEVAELFKLILEDKYESSNESRFKQIKNIDSKLLNLRTDKEILTGKLLKGVVDDSTYKIYSQKIDEEERECKSEKIELSDDKGELKSFLNFGVEMLQNVDYLYENGSPELKQGLLSSILDNKLVFKNGMYRTPKFKQGFAYIYQNTNKMKGYKIKTGDSLSNISRLVPKAGIEPALPEGTGF